MSESRHSRGSYKATQLRPHAKQVLPFTGSSFSCCIKAPITTHDHGSHVLHCLNQRVCLLQLAGALERERSGQCHSNEVAASPQVVHQLQHLHSMLTYRRARRIRVESEQCTPTVLAEWKDPEFDPILTNDAPPGLPNAEPSTNATPAHSRTVPVSVSFMRSGLPAACKVFNVRQPGCPGTCLGDWTLRLECCAAGCRLPGAGGQLVPECCRHWAAAPLVTQASPRC